MHDFFLFARFSCEIELIPMNFLYIPMMILLFSKWGLKFLGKFHTFSPSMFPNNHSVTIHMFFNPLFCKCVPK